MVTSSSLRRGGSDQHRNELHTRQLSSAELEQPSRVLHAFLLQMKVQFKYLVLIIQVINFFGPIYIKTCSPLHTAQQWQPLLGMHFVQR